MGLPFQAETIADLKARFPKALETVYDAEAIKYSGAKRPGESRDHVFDFQNGLRLIISRERMDDGEELIHVSASLEDGSSLSGKLKKLPRRKQVLDAFEIEARNKFDDLGGGLFVLDMVGFTGMVMHFRGKPISRFFTE